MDILILGGTQFVGQYMVHECLSRKHNVIVFNRGLSNPGLFSDIKNVKCINGDRTKNDDLKSLNDEKWDVVIDVPYFPTDIVKKSVDSLYDKAKKYVFISSMSVYDKNGDNEYIKYCKNKLESERLFYEKELKSLIFRPGILCGKADNTGRFDYTEDGIFWKGTKNLVRNYNMVHDFTKYVVDLIEDDYRGIYEY